MNMFDMLNNEKHILFIKGITADDYNDKKNNLSYFSNQEQADIEILYNSYKTPKFNTIPTTFTNLNNWIKSTNLKCWYCDMNFNNVPVFIPKYINLTQSGKILDVYGNFCSFSCAKSFLDLNKTNKHWEMYEQLKILFYIFHNKKISDIPTAPNKYDLKCYGGTMTENDFREKIQSLLQNEI